MQPTLRNGESREKERKSERGTATAPPAGSEQKGSSQPLSALAEGWKLSRSMIRRRPDAVQREGLRA